MPPAPCSCLLVRVMELAFRELGLGVNGISIVPLATCFASWLGSIMELGFRV